MSVLRGPRFLVDALRLLRTRKELWPLCVLPMLLNLLVFGLAAWAFIANLEELSQWISSGIPAPEAQVWYEWLWVGPLRAISWLVQWLLLLAFLVTGYFTFTVFGALIASPFLDVLSERIESICLGDGAPRPSASWREIWLSALRSLREEGKRVAFFVAIQLVFVVLALIPGAQAFAVAGGALFMALFLPLDYTGYVLDRRSVRFGQRRDWIWRNRTTMLGFGSTALFTLLIPGLNFLCLPLFVTAGTLLAIEVGPPQASSDSRGVPEVAGSEAH